MELRINCHLLKCQLCFLTSVTENDICGKCGENLILQDLGAQNSMEFPIEMYYQPLQYCGFKVLSQPS